MIKKKCRSILKFVGYKWMLPLMYKWYAHRPIDKTLVVFADHRDRETPDNFLSMYEMCQKEGFQCVILSGRAFGANVPRRTRWKERLKFHFEFVRLAACCRALFLVEYFPLAEICRLRKETDVIQLWHGCGAMKMFGYSTEGKKWGMTSKERRRYPMHTNYTLACVSGKKAVVPFEDAFRCNPGVVQAIGVPRTDIYFDETFKASAQEMVRGLFPQIGDRKIVLYAPTFRGVSIAKSHINLTLDFQKMSDALSDEYVIFLKFHPLMQNVLSISKQDLKKNAFVFDISELLTPEYALCVADVLITDYSSIMFEYLLLERPIISYIYDIEQYIDDRGLYYPYEEIAPGPYVYQQTELIEAIKTIPEWFDVERIRCYKEEFMNACDGHSTERIFKYVFKNETRRG